MPNFMRSLYKKIVVKIGTSVITGADGLLDLGVMQGLVDQFIALREKGVELIVVSSGAVGAGRSLIKNIQSRDMVSKRQVWAAVGQARLMATYIKLFAGKALCAQVLATKEDFKDKVHQLNMKNCFTALLQEKAMPIVNENDVVAVSELMFTDNDELAGLIAAMIGADALIILTDTEGLYTGHPSDKNATLIPAIDTRELNWRSYASDKKTDFGRGGMLTKGDTGHKLATLGIATHLANGRLKDVLLKIVLDKEQIGTKFIPHRRNKVSSVKRRIVTLINI